MHEVQNFSMYLKASLFYHYSQVSILPNHIFHGYLGSDAAELSGMGVAFGNGRKTRYKEGPKNGTSESGRSQEPWSYLNEFIAMLCKIVQKAKMNYVRRISMRW